MLSCIISTVHSGTHRIGSSGKDRRVFLSVLLAWEYEADVFCENLACSRCPAKTGKCSPT